MAIFIPGMKCPLCRNPIGGEDARRLFPPFVRNQRDPLYVFHDATVHEECLLRDSRSDTLTRVMGLLDESRRLRRTCIVCNEGGAGGRRFFSTDYITSDPSNDLYAFNYISVHQEHLSSWSDWERFRQLASLFQSSDAWDGPPIVPSQLLNH